MMKKPSFSNDVEHTQDSNDHQQQQDPGILRRIKNFCTPQHLKELFASRRARVAAVAVATVAVVALVATAAGVHKPKATDEEVYGREALNWDYSDDRVAAVVDDATITEGQVTRRVADLREGMGLVDDDDWAQWLDDQGTTAESVHNEYVSELVEAQLIRVGAERMHVQVTDDEVQASVSAARERIYQSYEESYELTEEQQDEGIVEAREPLTQEQRDRLWANALAEAGYTQETYEEEVRTSLLLEKVMDRLVSNTAYEVWHQDLVDTLGVTANPMPADLPYNTAKEDGNA